MIYLRDKDESALKLSHIEKKLLQKIGCLEAKVSLLENSFNKNMNTNSESKLLTKNDETQNIILDKESKSETIYDRKELNCKLCDKVFKTKSNLLNYDKKFHKKKGTKTYKCDNCNEKLDYKSNFENHINKEHIICNLCTKILPTITSLNIHITAVHDKLKTNHQIEKEPSWRTKKLQRI